MCVNEGFVIVLCVSVNWVEAFKGRGGGGIGAGTFAGSHRTFFLPPLPSLVVLHPGDAPCLLSLVSCLLSLVSC